WVCQAVISELVFIRFHLFCRDGGVLLPVLEIEQQIVHYRTVGLILNWNFQTPFVVAPADVDRIVAILDDDAVHLVSAKINDVLGPARGFFGTGPVSLDKKEISKNSCRDDEQDQCRFPLHEISATLSAPFPPNGGAEDDKDERHEYKDRPAQAPQSAFVQAEGERLRNFGRDSNELLAAQEPVCDRRNEIERLLVLRQRVVLNEGGVAHHHHTRRIHLDPLICAATFFDRNADSQRRRARLFGVRL